jgi:hypothetical protein
MERLSNRYEGEGEVHRRLIRLIKGSGKIKG